MILREKTESERIPIAFVAHDLGGIIVKKALVIARNITMYHSISWECTQLVFFGTPHRVSNSSSWEDLLSNALLASPLPSHIKGSMATRLRSLSTFLENLSARFISQHARRCIINVHQNIDGTNDTDLVINPDSATLGLVHETIVPGASTHHGICKFSPDGPVSAAILSAFEAETKSEYRTFLSRLFDVSPSQYQTINKTCICQSQVFIFKKAMKTGWYRLHHASLRRPGTEALEKAPMHALCSAN
ncbi:hypothetical protein B0H63DRAFT_71605 [Podospora didyma]|uniref:DUF676 domain-containing protein n=1 Tax=Podospora didyma TaxID=330526 RepID=A0AAE0K188_9PEZI|nr:hypothetical protein B0H63DRAFT_71605 [Podospora didyma]